MGDTPCEVHNNRLMSLEKSDDKQWSEIDGIQKSLTRLVPVWVTIVLMVSSALTGSALTFAGMIIKFSGNG